MKYIHRTGATYISTSEPYYLDGMRGSDNIIHDMPEWKTDDSGDQIIGGKIHIYAAAYNGYLFGQTVPTDGGKKGVPTDNKYSDFDFAVSGMILELNDGRIASMGRSLTSKEYNMGVIATIEGKEFNPGDPETYHFYFPGEYFDPEDDIAAYVNPAYVSPFFTDTDEVIFSEFYGMHTWDYQSPTMIHPQDTVEMTFMDEYPAHPEAYEIVWHIDWDDYQKYLPNAGANISIIPVPDKTGGGYNVGDVVSVSAKIQNTGNIPVTEANLVLDERLSNIYIEFPETNFDLLPGENRTFSAEDIQLGEQDTRQIYVSGYYTDLNGNGYDINTQGCIITTNIK